MLVSQMSYCLECGSKLTLKELQHEGMIPYCPSCQQFRFPIFNVAISAILLNEARDSILLIKQYDIPEPILVAGYVSKGENLETTIQREIMEELGLEALNSCYNSSQYYGPSNTLMVNFAVTVKGFVKPNHEIDDWDWYSIEEAKKTIKKNSLAEHFLLTYLNK